MEYLRMALGAGLLFAFTNTASAEVIVLVNQDRITGQILHENAEAYVVKTEAMGIVSIGRGFIEKMIREEKGLIPAETAAAAGAPDLKVEEKTRPKIWSGTVSGGFNRTRGNVKTTELSGGIAVKRKVEKKNEFDVKADAYYSAFDRRMNAQRYAGMIRYAYSFGEKKKWYNFYKTEGDRDRFANIDSRITPSAGLGYWFSDTDDWKAMAELGGGVTLTRYRDDQENETELVLVPRGYAEKKLIGKSRLSQEATFYPSMTDYGEYRLNLETVFKNPIVENLNLNIKWINDYNSRPGSDTKKHDMRLMSSVEYAF